MAQELERSCELWQGDSLEIEAPQWHAPKDWLQPEPETDSKQLGLRSVASGALLKATQGKKKLFIKLLRASNLLASIFSISVDPFVKVLVGQEEHRTQPASGTNPEWNEELDFMVSGTEE